MSRSTRKPYDGYEYRRRGTKVNRAFGHRMFRHAAKQQLSTVVEFDDFMPVHRREFWTCSPVFAGCCKSLWIPDPAAWSRYCLAKLGDVHCAKWHSDWPPKWYTDALRK
jgi:hypothetical protein